MGRPSWMENEMEPIERKKFERFIEPARQIGVICIFTGALALIVGILICIDQSVKNAAFLWTFLLFGIAGALCGYIGHLCCKMYIHKMFLLFRIEKNTKLSSENRDCQRNKMSVK